MPTPQEMNNSQAARPFVVMVAVVVLVATALCVYYLYRAKAHPATVATSEVQTEVATKTTKTNQSASPLGPVLVEEGRASFRMTYTTNKQAGTGK